MAEKDKRSEGPERLTYNNTLAIKAGEKFLEKMVEEMGVGEDRGWPEEWCKIAKKKSSMGAVEFLAEKTESSEGKILAMASRMTGIPMIDCEQVLGPNEPHFMIDGLPFTLLSSTDYGAKTLVHCIPFLETFLDKELLADMYGAIKINFALTSPSGMLKHIQRCYNSGRARNRMLARADEDKMPSFSREIELLHARELLPRDFATNASRQEILTAVEDERPRKGSPGETEWWALCADHPYINLAPISSGKELAEIMSPATQKRFGVVPVCEYGGILTVATKRGLQGSLRQEIIGELQKHCKIAMVICNNSTINEIIQTNLSNTISTTSIANQLKMEAVSEEEDTEIIDIQKLAENDEASIIKVVQSILVGAINKRATDIHVAAHEARTWIRYRIDGNMVDAPYQLPAPFWKAVTSRIKIMSNIDIRYSPTPQDGKFPMKVGGIDYDIRVNTCSTIYGEKAIMRIQKKDAEVPTLESLGFRPHEKKLIESLLESDHGMLVICGPTGSGKCLGKGTPVMKYDGNVVAVENIRTGDLLMGPDSKPRKVTHTNTGMGPLYEIQPTKGTPWICNDAHIMVLKHTAPNMTKPGKFGERVRNEGMFQAFGEIPKNKGRERLDRKHPEIADVCLKDIIERTPASKKIDQHWKLFRVPINFQTPPPIKKIPAEFFYYAGLWLGDGSRGCNEITNVDSEIIQWVETFAKEQKYRFLLDQDNRAPHIKRIGAKPSAMMKDSVRSKDFPFLYTSEGKEKVCLRTLLACCIEKPSGRGRATLKKKPKEGFNKKTIPLFMKTATRKQRLALLAGIMDSDGSLGTNCFEFTNKSKPLAEETAFLARSLGLWASPPKEKIIKEKTYWRITISGDTNIIPTKVIRKKAKPRKQKKDPLKTGWKPIPIGEGKYYGFTLEGDGRFLLGDFTVTHNTRTLSATMYKIDRDRWNVITAENPVEIRIPGVEQTPIDGKKMTFGKFVPAALRQDPDYIMIGETRDQETTEEVIRAAITGHIVMTTLHTNSAAGAPARLIDMGAEPFLVTDSLKVVIAQRLIRKLCTNCCRPLSRHLDMEKLKALGVEESWLAESEGLLEAVGCKICNQTGYAGRTSISEGYSMNSEIRRIILKEDGNTEAIKREMVAQGGKTLFQNAVELAAVRITSIQEALAIRDME